MDKKVLEQKLQMLKDAIGNPESYGMTREQINEWAINTDITSDIVEKIPESLRDELSDVVIAAYNARKKNNG